MGKDQIFAKAHLTRSAQVYKLCKIGPCKYEFSYICRKNAKIEKIDGRSYADISL